ncbi:MAG TPA: hypothetical protein VKT82_04920 [Ktedonobacterales bacterium]|nr:hypothetical protein [Ktedonobacterales bacterium]
MRLTVLEEGHAAEQKAQMQHMRVQGIFVSDMTKVCLYRPELFGKGFLAVCDAALHEQPSFWTQGERELFAAFVSSLNQCRF